jgi:hypothetical protein
MAAMRRSFWQLSTDNKEHTNPGPQLAVIKNVLQEIPRTQALVIRTPPPSNEGLVLRKADASQKRQVI